MRRRSGELLRVGLAVLAAVALFVVFWAAREQSTNKPAASPGHAVSATPGSRSTPFPSRASQPPTITPKQLDRYSQSRQSLRAKVEAQSRLQFSQFVMVSYNVLGASHTGGHGDRASWAAGSTRMRWAASILQGLKADVISLQEFQASQAATFRSVLGGTYDLWPTSNRGFLGQNSVAWRRSRFEMVTATLKYYPYFGGKPQPSPRVLLRDRVSGVEFWVTSYHNPFYKSNAGARHRAVAMQAGDARALLAKPDHPPLIVGGDMNDRAAYFCAYAGSAPMHAASGGSTAGGCSVPPLARPYGFDWIMGSPGVEFTHWGFSHSGLAARTSDHPVVYTLAKVWRGDRAPAN